MKCYLCHNILFDHIKKGVRDNAKLNVLKCNNCGLVTLDSFSHISDNFYEESRMHASKIKITSWLKETENDDMRRFLFLNKKIKNKTILDFGSGNGNFLLKSKNIAKKIYGVEPEKQFKSFFKEMELNVFRCLDEIPNSKFDLITAFHVFEHLKDPLDVLKRFKPFLKTKGEIIIEVPNSDDALLSLYNSNSFSDFTYWSQHLFLFNESTLEDLIIKAGFKVNFIKQIQRYPLSNHLYWLSKNLPNGQNILTVFNNKSLIREYTKILEKEKICDTLLVSISL